MQVRGDTMVATFDGVNGEDSNASTCLQDALPGRGRPGRRHLLDLNYDAQTAKFDVALATCIANPPGGAHNATLSPDGTWLGISNCCSDWAIDVVDLRGDPTLRYRVIDASKADATQVPGRRRVHVRDDEASRTARARRACGGRTTSTSRATARRSTSPRSTRRGSSTSSRILSGKVRPIAFISNFTESNDIMNPHNIEISHQADVTKDGKVLVVSDERGGGLSNTECNTGPGGVIGGAALLRARAGLRASRRRRPHRPSNPVKIGDFFIPNPMLAYDPLQAVLDSTSPRTERACTAHVFRLGGNGSTSPGPIAERLRRRVAARADASCRRRGTAPACG